MTSNGDKPVQAGVIGWPIDHSLSPVMMSSWIEQAGLSARYKAVAVDPVRAREDIRSLASRGFAGVNVTLPHKILAREIADEITEAARKIGAANLLTFKNGLIHADNTDARGFVLGLENDDIDYRAGRALVLGAGGAARAIIHGLVENGVSEICISNRTRSRAEALQASFDVPLNIVDWTERSSALSDSALIVNTTSMGLKGDNDLVLDWTLAESSAAVVDIVYAPLQTRFLRDANSHGLRTQNGLAMLVGQARPSFAALFGREAPDQPDMQAVLTRRLEASA